MSGPYLGELRLFGFDYAPQGWAACNGQSLLIAQYRTLFSLLGNRFGGDGKINFNLPDLRGRAPMGAGAGEGLTARQPGEMAGTEFSTLTEANLPRHNHALLAQRKAAAFQDPTENMLAMGVTHSGHETIAWNTYVPGPTTIPISNLAIGISGGNQAHENRQPVQVLNYCIATQGLFPPQP